MTDAEKCRQNGWGPGTRLVGNDGFRDTVIELTAVGENSVLAKRINSDGDAEYESSWTLQYREWREAAS